MDAFETGIFTVRVKQCQELIQSGNKLGFTDEECRYINFLTHQIEFAGWVPGRLVLMFNDFYERYFESGDKKNEKQTT